NPGAIARVELFDVAGAGRTVFQGVDTNIYARSAIGWFVVSFPTTDQPIERVRLTLDSVRVRGWNEIDAVQLVRGAVVVEDRPRLVVGLPDPANGRVTILQWPSGYRLERADRLDGGAWVTIATQPPVSIPLTAPHAFFRLAK
ncbi:MAG: hypothetical protein JNL97_12615, partial [Verrucomicrobiales bacterium]|nr:hypothetical protein [Verrucomicrobiales bacterium]